MIRVIGVLFLYLLPVLLSKKRFMNYKKKIKKAISVLVPKGYTKEKFKLFFYNLSKPKNTRYEVLKKGDSILFKTTYKNDVFYTNQALYPVVAHFDFYQKYYTVKEDDVVIDAGANMGHLSIFFSKNVGENGKVYSFEPDKFNIQTLLNNVKLNPSLPHNIIVQDKLLWDTNTFIDFEESGTVGSSAVWFSGKNSVVKKEAVTIDSWVKEQQLSRLDYIKMDIEGAEIEALDGCVETLKKFKPNFAIASYHIVNGEPTYIKVEEFFKKYNYPCKTVTFPKNEIITFAGILD